MMQSRYFSLPVVPNRDVKIDYFGPFSQFWTVFAVFVAIINEVDIEMKPFCIKPYLYSDKIVID